MRKIFVLVVAVLFMQGIVSAVDGDLDFGFGFGGTVITDFGATDQLTDLALQPDGKIIAAGASCVPPIPVCSLALARYNSNGSPDTTFGNSGSVLTALGGNDFTAVAVQPDGRIVVAGKTGGDTSDFAVMRYNNNGSLDTTFGSGGKVFTDFGGTDAAHDMALQPDGKIVVVGKGVTRPRSAFAVARYNSDGSLDRTFGTLGKVGTDLQSEDDSATGVAIQADGKIVVVGGACETQCVFATIRYNSDGSLDSNFGTDGVVTNDLSLLTNFATSVALQSDGKIVVGGGGDEMVQRVVRYLPDGRLDPTFGFEGTTAGLLSDASALAIQFDGKIVVASAARGFSLARYTGNGLVDTTFGINGQITTPLPGFSAGAGAVVVQPDGKIVAAGTMVTTLDSAFALVRYSGPVVPITLKFDPATVRVGGVFTTTIAGTNANSDTYFDVRFRTPGSIATLESFNWQFGSLQQHGVPPGTATGTWTITGVRAHQNFNDHFGDFTPLSANLTVIP